MLYCVQNKTFSCLADVVEYFIAKVGPSARLLHVDLSTLHIDGLSPSSPSSRLHSGAFTVGRAQVGHAAASPSSSSSSFSQFVYCNNYATTMNESSRSSVGSSGHSDTASSSPTSAHSEHTTIAAGVSAMTSSVSSSSIQPQAATVENASASSSNSGHCQCTAVD